MEVLTWRLKDCFFCSGTERQFGKGLPAFRSNAAAVLQMPTLLAA